jgi:hypothetical protein
VSYIRRARRSSESATGEASGGQGAVNLGEQAHPGNQREMESEAWEGEVAAAAGSVPPRSRARDGAR